ncbi:flagellar basal body P-ring biosynthesis protein [Campylobacter iguaniorum]|nr:flagellar basal body P-ring biosynthesis protein [Campylobacter iguaniorum]
MLQSRSQNKTSGNSSGVEHNLAKVGVASSNLVSRSILFLILIILFSQKLFSASLVSLLEENIKSQIPNIIIEKLNIQKPDNLPQDFNEYELKEILLLSLKDDGGNLRAVYKMPNNLNKSMFFKFDIKAKVKVFVASRDMDKGQILNLSDFESMLVPLNKYEKTALTSLPKVSLITKTRIKMGRVLTTRQFKTLSDIKRGDQITAIINDGSLSVEILVTALEDANIGEIIQVKNENNQIFKATIVSKNRAIIR